METSESIRPDIFPTQHSSGVFRRLGSIQQVQREGDEVVLTYRHGKIVVSLINATTFRVQLIKDEAMRLLPTAAVVKDAKHDVVFSIVEEQEAMAIVTDHLRVELHKNNGLIQAYNDKGQCYYSQQDVYWDQAGGVTCHLSREVDSHFYGLGETAGFLDKNNERYTMWNSDVYAPHVPEMESLYQSIPFLIHFRTGNVTSGLFVDNPGKVVFDQRSSKGTHFFQTQSANVDFYVFVGETIRDVLQQYTQITGRMSLPPKWAIGYQQSRYSYMTQEEVLSLARTFREKDIPCDVIYLDIHYMDEYRVFTWDSARFPDPKAMLAELREMGFRVVPIVDPGVKQDPKYQVYKEGVIGDYFCKRLEGDLFLGEVWPGSSAFPDFTQKKVASWWGDKHRFYTEAGIEGIWNDMNEPAIFNESKTMDGDVIHENDGDPKTHQELHNLYGMLMSKATYEGLVTQLQGKRPFVLTRAGYAGVQRYAAVWTGDNRSFWEHMAMAMPMVMNLGLSGIPFAGPDVGGFAHHTTGELLARWTQMGAFFPLFRNHSALDTIRQEPWAFGEKIEAIVREYIQLRYRLVPYMYNLFYEASQTGMPVIRPLVLEYQDDPQVINISDQFLVGSSLLVAPMYRPDTDHRVVYLPEGDWYDFWTGERYSGSQHVMVYSPLEKIPVFVRAGSIIPEEAVHQHASESPDGTLTMNVYSGVPSESQYTLYEDDGATFDYKSGKVSLLTITREERDTSMQLMMRYEKTEYLSQYTHLLFKVQHVSFVPSDVEGITQVAELADLGLIDEGWLFDSQAKILYVKVKHETGQRDAAITKTLSIR